MGGNERALVDAALDSNYVAPAGPQVEAFERAFCEYTGIEHCVALSSGTAAMHLALKELAVGPGDVVLASTLTFIGSVSPVTFLGAEPVFIDADPDTWNMDVALLAQELDACATAGQLPKAVIPTDLYGQCADLDAIQAVCAPYAIPVVIDSAEAMGARYKDRHAGAGAAASVYSFNGNKIITTSGGGILASSDKTLIDRARYLSTQARDPAPHYQHSEIGFNYRLSNVLAAIGCSQLAVLDERVEQRRANFERYRRLLAGVPTVSFMPEADTGRCNRWLTVLRIDPERSSTTPEQVRLALEAENIEARPVWKPMHLQPVFSECRVRGGGVAETIFAEGLCLPSGTKLTVEQQERIAGIVRRTVAID